MRNSTGGRWSLIIAVATISSGLSPPTWAQRQLEVGVGTHLGHLVAIQSALDSLNISFRDSIFWWDVESTEGKLEYPPLLGNMDLLVSDAVARKHPPILLLPRGNKFYDNGDQITSPIGLAAYARYAQFVVQHFKGRVTQFEVWNEWEQGYGAAKNNPNKGDPVAYANLLKAAYPAMKAANPNAVVIAGGISGNDTPWVQKFAQAGGLQYMDGFSIHPYVQCWGPIPEPPSHVAVSSAGGTAAGGQAPAANIAATSMKILDGTPEQSIKWIDQLHATLKQLAPSRSLSIYVTEVGWPTNTGKCGVSEAIAAAYLQRFMLLAAARPYIAAVWWYDLFDDGADPTNAENRFGIAQTNYSPKPAYGALVSLQDALSSGTVPTESFGTDGEIVVSGTESNGKTYYAAWLPTNNLTDSHPWTQGVSLSSNGFRPLAAGLNANSSPSVVNAIPTFLVHQ